MCTWNSFGEVETQSVNQLTTNLRNRTCLRLALRLHYPERVHGCVLLQGQEELDTSNF
jgi:hypothetical protein